MSRIIIETQILPYPYTYLPAKAVKEKSNSGILIRWYSLENGVELPPFIGYGDDMQKKINAWYAAKRNRMIAHFARRRR